MADTYSTYKYTYGEYEEIAFMNRNDMSLAVWEGEGRMRLYSYNLEDPFRERVGRFIHNGLSDMWKNKEFCDLDVIIGGKVFKCHRVIMASVSRFFKDKLTSNGQEKDRDITLDENYVKPEIFQNLLDLLYEGKNAINDSNAMEMMKAATYLNMKALEFRILDVLQRKLTEQSCMKIWDWAEKNNVPSLASKAKGVALTHFQVLRHTEEFLQMPVERISLMLGHDLLKYRFEDDILEAVLDWVGHNVADRREHLHELLPYVCFPYLSTRYLNELRKNELIGLKTEFSSYLDEALTYHLAALQKDGKKIQTEVLRRLSASLKRPMPHMRRVVLLLGGQVIQGTPMNSTIACYLEMAHPMSNLKEILQFSVASMPHSIGLNFASSVWKQDIYVSGGSDAPSTMLVFRPSENSWTLLKSVPEGRENHCMVAVNAKLYLLGGRTSSRADQQVLSEVMVYDIDSKTWTEETSDLPCAVEGAAAVAMFDKIYIIGGRNSSGESTSLIQCLDTESGECGIAGQLPISVDGAKAILLGRDIVLVCPDGSIFKICEGSQKKQQLMVDASIGDGKLLPPIKKLFQIAGEEKEEWDSPRGEKELCSPEDEEEEENADGKDQGEEDQEKVDVKGEMDEEDGRKEREQEEEEEKEEEEEEKEEAEEEEKEEEEEEKEEEKKEEAEEEEKEEEEEEKEKVKEKKEDEIEKEEAEEETAAAGVENPHDNEETEQEETKDKGEKNVLSQDRALPSLKEEKDKTDLDEDEETDLEEVREDEEAATMGENPARANQVAMPDSPTSSLNIEKVATMEKRRNFGLFIRKVDVIVVGGESENGNFLDDMLRIHLPTGQVCNFESKLTIPLSGMQVECSSIHQNYLVQFFDAASCF